MRENFCWLSAWFLPLTIEMYIGIGVAIKFIVIGGKFYGKFYVVIILAKQAKNVVSCRKKSKHIKISLV
jgi:hypothetical protein